MSMQQPEPRKTDWVVTESLNTILVVIDGPGDTTIRPRPPNIPHSWPRPELPPDEPLWVEPK
jgi:hypothetical protein